MKYENTYFRVTTKYTWKEVLTVQNGVAIAALFWTIFSDHRPAQLSAVILLFMIYVSVAHILYITERMVRVIQDKEKKLQEAEESARMQKAVLRSHLKPRGL